MRTQVRPIAMIAVIAAIAFASPASAQSVKKSTLSGTAFMATVSTNTGTVPLYTAPAPGAGFAMITSVCGIAGVDTGSPHISGSTLGFVAIGSGSGCIQFPNGLTLPPSEVLSFVNPYGGVFGVTISGVISK